MSILQERLKERRLALNLTLLDVADALGVKEATAQRYESGEIKNIKHETIVELSKLFRCTPQYLMGWSDDLLEKPSSPNSDFHLSEHEKEVVIGYRRQPAAVRDAIDTMLHVEPLSEKREKRA
jgi:transcriptional regulator with XRE-family HTH domain